MPREPKAPEAPSVPGPGQRLSPRPGAPPRWVAHPRLLALLGTLALLLLALALRLPRGDLAEWKGDEAIEFAKARAIAHGGARPRGIPTTEGPRAPPHQLYAFAIPLLVDDEPEACRTLVVLLSSGAIAGLFWFGRGTGGGRAALVAALALAVLPGAVRSGRWAWIPNLTGPLAALVLAALVQTVRTPRSRAAGALLPVSVLLGIIHYSPVGVAALGVGASAWALWRGANRRALGLGLGLSLVLIAPFAASELGSGFETTRSVFRVAAHGGRASTDPDAPARARLAYGRLLLGAFDLESFARALGPMNDGASPTVPGATPATPLLGETAVRTLGPPRLLLRGLGGALTLLALGGALLGARELVRALLGRERLGTGGVALALVLAAWAPFFGLKLPAREHYVPCALPAALLLVGVALEWGTRRTGRVGAVFSATFLAALAVTSVLETRAVLVAVDQGQAKPASAYDLPFRDKKAACELVLDRGLELVSYRRFEDMLLLEQCFRERQRRDPDQGRRFERVSEREPYWELDYARPRPLGPHERAAFRTAPGPEALPDELGRCGFIVIERLR